MKDFLINNPKVVFKENLTHSILSQSNSYNFHTSKNYYNKTSLLELKSLSKEIGVKSISIKDESNRFGLNSFKVLGSTFAIDKILDKQPKIDTFCTATDGNHGKGLAWAAQNINKKVVVYVPKDTTLERIKEIEKYNANVYQLNLNYEDTCVYAFQESKKNNWCLVQDASWDNYEEIPALIMSGYLTHFKEIECFTNNMTKSKYDIIFLQCGVGSWAASCIWYYMQEFKNNRPKIVLIEPDEACGVYESFANGKRCSPRTTFNTIMAGLNCGIPSKSAWKIIQQGCDAVLKISDTDTKKAIKKLYYPKGGDPKIVSGESGAAGLAGLLKVINNKELYELKSYLNLNKDSKILLFNTEGDTDENSFKKIISN
jgi:diaminopropionate ammonia-lyase